MLLSQQMAHLNDLSHSSNGKREFTVFVLGFFIFLTDDILPLKKLLRQELKLRSVDQNFFQGSLRDNWSSSQISPWVNFLPKLSHSLVI